MMGLALATNIEVSPVPSNAARGYVTRNGKPERSPGSAPTSLAILTRIPLEWSVLSWVLHVHHTPFRPLIGLIHAALVPAVD